MKYLILINKEIKATIINGRSNLTPEMAVRIAKSTNTSPESWINMQTKLDLWKVRQTKIINTAPFKSHVA